MICLNCMSKKEYCVNITLRCKYCSYCTEIIHEVILFYKCNQIFQNLKVFKNLLNHFVLLKIYTCYKSWCFIDFIFLLCNTKICEIFYIQLIFRIIISYKVIKNIYLIEINKNVQMSGKWSILEFLLISRN